MNKSKDELAKLLHDFKSPLSSTRMALYFILDGRVGSVNGKVEKILQEVLVRNEKLLENIQKFEQDHV